MLERAIIARLQQQLGDEFQVRALEPGQFPRNFVALSSERSDTPPPGPEVSGRPFMLEIVLPDGEAVAFRMPAPRPGPELPRRIFIDFGVLTLILGAVLYAMTRTITRPLGKLAEAADAVGRGMNVEPLPEQGSRELRAATRAFNAMQERLRRYLDSRTRVLAAMSHDIRTPLTRLRLRVESIEDEQLRARCTADLDEMNNMVKGALAVFRGLNDEGQATPIDMNVLLEALRDEHRELGATVTLEGRANRPFVGKPLALKRCLGNLLQNAIQYGHEAHVKVEDGAALIVRIRDRGPGIPEDALDRVFEPFFRLESSRNRGTGGTGLGLGIARDIAQAHGGTITLRNVDGGLEAELALPR
jgi:signal transduction histidine kinase